MHSLLGLLVLTGIAGTPDLLSDMMQVAKSEGSMETAFVIERESKDDDVGAIVDLRRGEDRASLSVRLYKVASEAIAQSFWKHDLIPQLVYTDPYAAFSSLPIGESTRRFSSPGGYGIDTYDGTFFVMVQVTYRGKGALGHVQWQTVDREGDKVACEGLARRCLARLRNLEARAARNVTVGNVSVPSAIGPRGDSLVQLTTYCAARGVSLTVNQRQGTASFTGNGRQVVVPLAAKRIKAGSEWYDSNDTSIIRDGHWYVPLTAIENAYRG